MVVFNSTTLLASSDAGLQGVHADAALQKRWRSVASQEALDRFIAAAEKKGWKVVVVNNKAEALDAVIAALPDGSSIYSTGSTSLDEIGFPAYAKDHPEKWNNLKPKLMEAFGDPIKRAHVLKQVHAADYVLTTPVAVTEAAELLTADGTNTRVGPTMAAEKLVVLVGGQKLVPDLATARQRLSEWALPLESARMRQALGYPGSAVNYVAEIREPGHFGFPSQITFIFSKEELGF